MKKTLIALAVLAASGASFAQVTITGNLAMGYRASTAGVAAGSTASSNDTAGFGTDTSEIDFAATEDLGGGMKVVAKMALAGADRSGESNGTTVGGVTGRDGSLALYTTVGIFSLASVQAGDYLSGSGGQSGLGAYYNGFDGKVFSARTNRDVVAYTLPIGAWTLATSYQETSAAASQGLGLGTTGSNSTVTPLGQNLTTYGATYASGAIAANITYLDFRASTGGTRNQSRLSGSYDFGVVKLGAGAVVTNGDNSPAANPKVTDMLVAATVPLGSLTLGLQFAQRRYDDQTAATLAAIGSNGTVAGTSIQAAYALSKRTSMIANYARWDGSVGNTTQSSQTNLLLSHSF